MTKEVFGVQGTGPKRDRFLTRSVKANGLVFTTLHHGFDPADYDPTVESGTLPDDVETQTRFALQLLEQVLVEAGSGLTKALKVSVYVNTPGADDLERVNAALAEFFSASGITEPPLCTTIRAGLVEPGVAADMVALA